MPPRLMQVGVTYSCGGGSDAVSDIQAEKFSFIKFSEIQLSHRASTDVERHVHRVVLFAGATVFQRH